MRLLALSAYGLVWVGGSYAAGQAHVPPARSLRLPRAERDTDGSPTAQEHSILVRQAAAGGKCGPAAGGTACAAGLCCSAGGLCGTGLSFCGAPGCQLSFGPACDGNRVPAGKDTSGVPRPLFGNVPYGVSISHCSVPGKVALTFDDGPYIYTGDLLDLLKKNNIRATFFVVGTNGGKGQIQDKTTGFPALLQRMYSDGHQIGSHTWSHEDLSAITAQQRRDQIIRNEIALVSILGFFPTYLRPPYTRWTPQALEELKQLGYHVTNYDVDTRDWQDDYGYAQNLYTSILAGHSPASSSWVAIAHDIQDKTVHGFVQYMIDQARRLNYQLVTLGDCLGDPPSNWYRDPTTGQPYNGVGVRPQAAAVPVSTVVAAPTSTPTSVDVLRFGAGTGTPTEASRPPGETSFPTSTLRGIAPAKTNISRPEVLLAALVSSFTALVI